MSLHKNLLKSVFGKAALATAALGGFLFFAGAPSAQARVWDERPPARVIVQHRNFYPAHRVFVREGFYGPRAFYGVRPAYRIYRPHQVFIHGYRDRFGCWHRY